MAKYWLNTGFSSEPTWWSFGTQMGPNDHHVGSLGDLIRWVKSQLGGDEGDRDRVLFYDGRYHGIYTTPWIA